MNDDAKEWLEQAQADIKTAKDNLSSHNFYVTVIFSQQAAEKALKAVFILNNGKLPPKIHDLVELCNLVNAPEELYGSAESLSGTYISSRYPGAAPKIPAKYYTESMAKDFLVKSEAILLWTKKILK